MLLYKVDGLDIKGDRQFNAFLIHVLIYFRTRCTIIILMLFQYWYTLEQDVQCHRAGYNDLWEGGVSVQLQTGPVPHRTSRLVESGTS